MSKLYCSEDNGETFKELPPLSEVPEVATGGLVEFGEVFPYLGETSGCVSFKIKKRHMSRKYKKKNGLLKRQRRRIIKSLEKTLRKTCAELDRLGRHPKVFLDGKEIGGSDGDIR